jgi:arylsulfatase A-like enzyme
VPSGVQPGLHYHLDVAATVVDLAGARQPRAWDGRSLRADLEAGRPAPGRDQLVLTQGAWSCQRALRWGDHLYLRTVHDGFHPHWEPEMLFDLAADPHEQTDLADAQPERVADARARLDAWVAEQLDRSYVDRDPLDTILAEGGPCHVQGHLLPYLERLRATGRSHWADVLEARHVG